MGRTGSGEGRFTAMKEDLGAETVMINGAGGAEIEAYLATPTDDAAGIRQSIRKRIASRAQQQAGTVEGAGTQKHQARRVGAAGSGACVQRMHAADAA